jgi:hypothetical protein
VPKIVKRPGEIQQEKKRHQSPVTITLYVIGNLKKGRGRAVTSENQIGKDWVADSHQWNG